MRNRCRLALTQSKGKPARVILWSFIVLFVAATALRSIRQAAFSSAHRTDMLVYMGGARAMAAGQNPYRFVDVHQWHFVAPPFAAVFLVPFGLMPIAWAAAAWYVFSAVLLLLAFRLALDGLGGRWVGVPVTPADWFIPFLLVGKAVAVTLTRGQLSILVAFLVTLSFWLAVKRRNVASGALAGLAAALKITPVLLIGLFIIRRDWKALLGFVVAFSMALSAPALLLGFGGLKEVYRDWALTVAIPAVGGERSPVFAELLDPGLPRNQSVFGVTYRIATAIGARIAASLSAVALTINLLLTAGTGRAILSHRSEDGIDRTATEFSLFMLLILFTSPVSWDHYYVLMLLPLVLVTRTALHAPPPLARRAAQSLVAAGVLSSLDLFIAPAHAYGAQLGAALVVFGFILVLRPERGGRDPNRLMRLRSKSLTAAGRITPSTVEE